MKIILSIHSGQRPASIKKWRSRLYKLELAREVRALSTQRSGR